MNTDYIGRKMNNNTLSIRLDKDKNIDDLLKEVEREIILAGGLFKGDNQKGQFSGKTALGRTKGEYLVTGGEIKISITAKPRFVPMNKILSKIATYFEA